MLRGLRSRFLVLLHDLAWVPVSVLLAFALRFNFEGIPQQNAAGMLWMLGVTSVAFAGSFWYFGLHRAVWQFVSFPDLVRLARAVATGLLLSGLALFVLQRFEGIPRSVVVIFPTLLMAGLATPRLLYRWLVEQRLGAAHENRSRALIIGAGPLGEAVIRHLRRNGTHTPAAAVDADPRMHGKELHGVRVMGGLTDVAHLVRSLRIDLVVLAAPEASPTEVEQLITLCTTLRIPCRTVPFRRAGEAGAMEEFRLRPITIGDLLRREPIVMDPQAIAQHLNGKRVLVTGGGGSIGSELCRQIAAQAPDMLIVFECSEYNLYQIDAQLRQTHPGMTLHAILGDVKHEHSVETVFRRFAPEIVFHAAAYKHVPLLESNPIPAVQNNVFGTKLMAEAAHRHGCTHFVLISSDKAVNPSNVMGATKRTAELYCQNLNARSGTHFITTRFGNVLGSVGSVVPRFEAQIAAGGPVTVTHPEMRRYFMTIPEAVTLILQASAMGKGGEIFALDMGDPVRIVELAERMIRLAGLTPYTDIPIVFSGLRPGEKLFEELFHQRETLRPTSNPKILLAGHRRVEWSWLEHALGELRTLVEQGRRDDVVPQVQRIVPEFVPRGPDAPRADERPLLRVVE